MHAVVAVHSSMAEHATRAVNVSLTLRNWLIGGHISGYELAGADRAAYGERLFESLAERLRGLGVPRVDARELRRFRRFYETYPQIRETVSPEFAERLPAGLLGNRETVSPTSAVPGRTLVERLSFSHLQPEELSPACPTRVSTAAVRSGGFSQRTVVDPRVSTPS